MRDPKYQKVLDRMRDSGMKYGLPMHRAHQIFDDCTMYPQEDVLELHVIADEVQNEKRPLSDLEEKLASMKKLPDAPERIYLWPKGKMPEKTVYTDNSDFMYHHDPGFEPYMLEVLLPEDVQPKGAILMIPGGDHGDSTVGDGYGCSRDFNARGYQCFILHCRVYSMPWVGEEVGVDVARAIRMVRANAEKYRIDPNNIAVAGYSNGGICAEQGIQYCSGPQTVKQHFPQYEPDELDGIYGAPDAFLCIYGPRHKGMAFDYTQVKYPPVFYAVGRLDGAMENLEAAYPTLMEHGVPVEVHTFAGVPHGQAGFHYTRGTVTYPNWELWQPLADAFLQDVFRKK